MSKLNLRARLAAALLSLAPAALAGAALAQDADAISIRVSYADLDLSRPVGRMVLQRRIASAVNHVCGEVPTPMELGRLNDYDRCRAKAKADADRKVAAILNGTRYADASLKVTPAAR